MPRPMAPAPTTPMVAIRAHSPVNFGARLSRNAARPSRASAVEKTRTKASFSSASPSASGSAMPCPRDALDLGERHRRQCRDRLRDGERAGRKIGRVADLGDQPPGLGGLGGDRLGGEEEPHGAMPAERADEPLRGAAARHDAELRLGIAELHAARGEDDVGAERELQPAAERMAVERRDQRLRKGGERLPERADLGADHVLGRARREHADIGAGGEDLARCR